MRSGSPAPWKHSSANIFASNDRMGHRIHKHPAAPAASFPWLDGSVAVADSCQCNRIRLASQTPFGSRTVFQVGPKSASCDQDVCVDFYHISRIVRTIPSFFQ